MTDKIQDFLFSQTKVKRKPMATKVQKIDLRVYSSSYNNIHSHICIYTHTHTHTLTYAKSLTLSQRVIHRCELLQYIKHVAWWL